MKRIVLFLALMIFFPFYHQAQEPTGEKKVTVHIVDKANQVDTTIYSDDFPKEEIDQLLQEKDLEDEVEELLEYISGKTLQYLNSEFVFKEGGAFMSVVNLGDSLYEFSINALGELAREIESLTIEDEPGVNAIEQDTGLVDSKQQIYTITKKPGQDIILIIENNGEIESIDTLKN